MECRACPFECGVDRSQKLGVCRASDRIEVSQAQLHYWEEPPISGTRGSGTIFFTHCNLSCRFCQNYEISQLGRGRVLSNESLVAAMLRLQDAGAHNINLVTPTQYTIQLIPVLESVRPKLQIPIVWNSNGYEKPETLARLAGLVQVYLPDIKYHSPLPARAFSSAPDYFHHAARAILEMRDQTWPDRFSPDGIMQRGIIIRHLVLPGQIEDSKRILTWIRDTLGPETRVSLMAQYYPTYKAARFADTEDEQQAGALLKNLARRLSPAEYAEVRDHFEALGFTEGYVQDLASAISDYTPDFDGRGL